MDLTGLTFDDVLLKPQRGVLEHRKEADISCPELNIDIPILSAPMPSVASIEFLKSFGSLGGLPVVNRMKTTPTKVINDFFATSVYSQTPVGIAIGLDEETLEFYLRRLKDNAFWNTAVFVLDVAHAHTDRVIDFVSKTKAKHPTMYLMVGNVATYEAAQDLLDAGADALKVGIGPGSVCTTRMVTGFGVPQLEAIQACKAAVAVHRIPVIADGGIKNSGDIVKALAAGADAVMIGGLFANSIESNSTHHYGCASKRVNGHNAPEGTEYEIGERFPLEEIVKSLTWGIRSGLSYGGATNIRELQENAEWTRISDAGRRESKLA